IGDVLPLLSARGFRSSSETAYNDYFNFNPKSERMDLLAIRWWLSDKPIDGLTEVGRIGSTIIYERLTSLPVFWILREDGRQVPAPIKELNYTQNTITATLSEPVHGTLVFAQAAYPGWTALVDGKKAPVSKEGIFLATHLEDPAQIVTL